MTLQVSNEQAADVIRKLSEDGWEAAQQRAEQSRSDIAAVVGALAIQAHPNSKADREQAVQAIMLKVDAMRVEDRQVGKAIVALELAE